MSINQYQSQRGLGGSYWLLAVNKQIKHGVKKEGGSAGRKRTVRYHEEAAVTKMTLDVGGWRHLEDWIALPLDGPINHVFKLIVIGCGGPARR